MNCSKNFNATSKETDALLQRWRATDAENLAQLKEIIAVCGWPSGKAGSHSAWLLAQHADSDIAHWVPTLRHLLDRCNLEFFRVSFPAHVHSFSLELWFKSVYKIRGDSSNLLRNIGR